MIMLFSKWTAVAEGVDKVVGTQTWFLLTLKAAQLKCLNYLTFGVYRSYLNALPGIKVSFSLCL